MSSLKDIERCTRLYEKELDSLADQLCRKEAALRRDVDRLLAGHEALTRALGARDPGFLDAYHLHERQLLGNQGEGGEQG